MKDVQELVMDNILPRVTEKYHAIDHPKKRRKSQRSPKDSKLEIFNELEDMEVDMSERIPDWDIMHLAESKALAKELAQEGPTFFEDKSVRLHHTNYQKDSRNLSL